MTPSATITAVGFSQLNYYPKRQDTLHQKVSQNTLQNFEVSHPIAFGRAYLLATCFCVFSFIFPKLLYCRPSALRLMWCGFEPHMSEQRIEHYYLFSQSSCLPHLHTHQQSACTDQSARWESNPRQIS